MPVRVAMYDKGLQHIRPRLTALGLDLEVITFDKSGTYQVAGGTQRPAEVDVDYMWLNSSINADGFQAGAFDLCLATRSIKVLQTFNAGLDHPFYKVISAKGTRICNSSAQAVAISEYVLAQVFAVFQPIGEQRALQAAKQWKITPYREIAGTHWLIVGFGPIGQEIARKVKALGATTAVVRRKPELSETVDKAGTLADAASLAAEADVIVLACPLTAATRGFAGERFFAAAKKGATLVNIARGGVIDDPALLAALDRGQVATAILDVFNTEPLPVDHAYWAHPNVRLTGHTSFAGSGVRGRWDRLFLDNLPRFVRGEPLRNEFDPRDFP
jgi:phosphoglycerate dehydrogenase-like enzyme